MSYRKPKERQNNGTPCSMCKRRFAQQHTPLTLCWWCYDFMLVGFTKDEGCRGLALTGRYHSVHRKFVRINELQNENL